MNSILSPLIWRAAVCGSLLSLTAVASGAEEPAKSGKASAEKPQPPAAPQDAVEGTPGGSDPFSPAGEHGEALRIPAARLSESRSRMRVRIEVWELSANDAARRLDDSGSADWLKAFREDALANKLQAHLVANPAVAADQQTPAGAEAIIEQIYPTEYEPPVFPEEPVKPPTAEPASRLLEAMKKVPLPTSFETRNTGQSVEAVVQQVTAEKGAWDVAVTFNDTQLLKYDSWGAPEMLVKEPRFSTFHTGGLVRVTPGQWRLLSVLPAPHDDEAKDNNQRWLTIVRLDEEK